MLLKQLRINCPEIPVSLLVFAHTVCLTLIQLCLVGHVPEETRVKGRGCLFCVACFNSSTKMTKFSPVAEGIRAYRGSWIKCMGLQQRPTRLE